jgi:hypothetical protein
MRQSLGLCQTWFFFAISSFWCLGRTSSTDASRLRAEDLGALKCMAILSSRVLFDGDLLKV